MVGSMYVRSQHCMNPAHAWDEICCHHMPLIQCESIGSVTRRTDQCMLNAPLLLQNVRTMRCQALLPWSRPIRCCNICQRTCSQRPIHRRERSRSPNIHPPSQHGPWHIAWVVVTGQGAAHLRCVHHHCHAYYTEAHVGGHTGSSTTFPTTRFVLRAHCRHSSEPLTRHKGQSGRRPAIALTIGCFPSRGGTRLTGQTGKGVGTDHGDLPGRESTQ